MTIKLQKEYRSVMGIDASSNSFAYSIFVDEELVEWGEIYFSGKTVFERLHNGQDKLRSLSDRFDVDLICFESAVFVRNKKTVVLLAYTFGALVAALMDSGAEVKEIPPITWQYAIQNKPLTKAEKEDIQKGTPGKSKSWYDNKYREERKRRTMRWVEDNYGVTVDSDNISDAIALGHVAAVLKK